MTAYYNENDPFAAEWLRNLIAAGLIADGVVDERSITEVQPEDLEGYTQCHFFAGIGGWSAALRLAAWSDDVPVWTGSCPCQPFSAAGNQQGTKDERHLWPEFLRLIAARKPEVVFGEQVASSKVVGAVTRNRKASTGDGPVWFDGVSADLEAENYTVGAAVLGAHSVLAPHIRQRLFWVAHRNCERSERWGESGDMACETGRTQVEGNQRERLWDATEYCSTDGGLPNSRGTGPLSGTFGSVHSEQESNGARNVQPQRHVRSPDGRLGDTIGQGPQGHAGDGDNCCQSRRVDQTADGPTAEASGDGFWSDYRIVSCRDGKARRVGPTTSVLAPRLSGRVAISVPGSETETHWYNRVGALKGLGNAIVPQVAAEFVQAFMETE